MNTVRVNGLHSPVFISTNGLKQGNNLSPTQFNVFIDDLLKALQRTDIGIHIDPHRTLNCMAYADDIVLVVSSAHDLQSLLNTTHEWCKKWRVLINGSKTKAVHFRSKGCKATDTHLLLGTMVIDKARSYKYLGIWLDEHLNGDVMIEALKKGGSWALGNLISKTRYNYDLSYSSYTKLFETTVLPILDYSCGSWACVINTNVHQLDQIQQRAARLYCGVPHTTPLVGLEGDIRWCPGGVRRDVESL